MTQQVRDAQRVLVIASPAYRRRAEGGAAADDGRGVQWEARLIRDLFYADQQAGLRRFVPVVLPDCSAGDIPLWLGRSSTTHYEVSDYTVPGAGKLLRLLTGQALETEPPLGPIPVLLPRGADGPSAAPSAGSPTTGSPERPALVTELVIDAGIADDGRLRATVSLAGATLCQRQEWLPAEVADVWRALRQPPADAAQRMADAGRRLAATLLDEAAARLLGDLLNGLPPGDRVEVTLRAGDQALALPVELIRLATDAGAEVGPLALWPGVSVSRQPGPAGHREPGPAIRSAGRPLAGPLKILAAVAAPDETKTPNVALNVEAEMQAVLDAVTDVAGHPHAQVRILEVASLAAIRQALAEDAYHVLHLSAHGSPDLVELEDEDGASAEVTPNRLMQGLRHAEQPVPLIMLSSCSGGSGGAAAMAASLIAQGADRVIAMLAPVTDGYATDLARHFYRELATHQELTAGQALARARYLAEDDRARAAKDHLAVPEYGLATLLTAAGDAPLVDPAAAPRPLSVVTARPDGRSVRELPMGALIGRRPQLRSATEALRRTPAAVHRTGFSSGVQLTGIGGIGKTALAGRVMSRLRADGWLIAVHEGR
jgi:hypothetical protein